jgi:hypothetical protein
MNPFHKPHRLKISASILALLQVQVPVYIPTPSFFNPGPLWMFRQTAYTYPYSVGNFAVGLLTDSLLFRIGFSHVVVCIRQVVDRETIFIFIPFLMMLGDPTLYEVSMLKYVVAHHAPQERYDDKKSRSNIYTTHVIHGV